MTGSMDHDAARDVLRDVMAVARADPESVAGALAHVQSCDSCAAIFEVERTTACRQAEEGLADIAGILREGGDLAGSVSMVATHVATCLRCNLLLAELMRDDEGSRAGGQRVDTVDLFERALVRGLSESETLVRLRAAEKLGSLENPGIAVLGALAEVATDDADRIVRGAALEALDLLDATVSIPQRLVDEWAASPALAVSFITGVLDRLARSVIPSVTGLVTEPRRETRSTMVTGQGTIGGNVVEDADSIWLKLRGLPAYLENTQPIVGLPMALGPAAPSVEWLGDRPGLVPAQDAISGGSLDVRLATGTPPRTGSLYEHMYLLSPDVHREGSGT